MVHTLYSNPKDLYAPNNANTIIKNVRKISGPYVVQ